MTKENMFRENRVYLNTVEDVIDALQKGETVYEKDCKGEDKVKYYMYNGVIISQWFTDGCNKFINSGSLYVEKNRYFCYRKEPIKMIIGEFYRTRDGHKAIYVYKSQNPSDKDKPFAMSIIGSSYSYFVKQTGEAYISGDDIVDYWED